MREPEMQNTLDRRLIFRGFVVLAIFGVASAAMLGWALPAAAHANTVSAVTSCVEDGQIHVVWSIVNDFDGSETATYSGSTAGVVVIPAFGTGLVPQTLPASAAGTTISLHVEAVWSDGFEGAADGSVTLPGDCPVPPGTPVDVPLAPPITAVVATPELTG